jgi:hypothetical protein
LTIVFHRRDAKHAEERFYCLKRVHRRERKGRREKILLFKKYNGGRNEIENTKSATLKADKFAWRKATSQA